MDKLSALKKLIENEKKDGINQIELNIEPLAIQDTIFQIYKLSDRKLDYLIEMNTLPCHLTRIKINLIPGDNTQKLYSFNGVETILNTLFTIEEDEVVGSLMKYKNIYLNVSFFKDEFYSIPVMSIEIFFWGRLNSGALQYFEQLLRGDILNLTGVLGEIEVIKIKNSYELKNIMTNEKLNGHPLLTFDEIYRNKNFTTSQIEELNLLMLDEMIELDTKELINHPFLKIYYLRKYKIEHNMRELKLRTYGKIIDELLRESIDENTDDDDDNNELPF